MPNPKPKRGDIWKYHNELYLIANTALSGDGLPLCAVYFAREGTSAHVTAFTLTGISDLEILRKDGTLLTNLEDIVNDRKKD